MELLHALYVVTGVRGFPGRQHHDSVTHTVGDLDKWFVAWDRREADIRRAAHEER